MAAAAPLAAQDRPRAQTIQQAFDGATALSDAGKHSEALAAWQALEPRVKSNARTLAVVRVRKGNTLLRLNRLDEASAAVNAGLAALSPSDPALAEDRVAAHLALGTIDRQALDYAGALAHFRAAAAMTTSPTERFGALLGEVKAGTFVDPAGTEAAAATLQQMTATVKMEPAIRALALVAISELQLNLGKFAEARTSATQAVKDLGGLTLRASSTDAAARSDVALAALLLGNKDEARRYLAYTGAGRSPVKFPSGQVEPPQCGGDSGIAPTDVAVIEFTIDDDGAVTDSAPVYASRKGGDVALSFARAARNWSFSPEALKDLQAFFRTRVRLEMRCSTAFPRPALSDYLRAELAAWLDGKGALLPTREQSNALRLRADRAALAAAGPTDRLALVPTLFEVADNGLAGREEANAAAVRALAILDREGAPPLARLAAERLVWQKRSTRGDQAGDYRDALARAAGAAPYAADPGSRNVLKLMLADAFTTRNSGEARTLLQGIGADGALPANHPLKVGALVRLASLEQRKDNLPAAQQAFQRSGLSAQQCALLDTPPKMLSINTSAYPQEAVAWGFEGWVRVQNDVDAEGRPIAPRAIAAYPPFVFSDASVKSFANARYTKSYRPDGGLGCGGLSNNIRFVLGS
jgi:hypothetical protein